MLPDALLRIHVVILMEIILSLLATALVFFIPKMDMPLWRKFTQGFDLIARREKISILLVAVLAFAGSMAVSLLIRFPEPTIHDEFSYLLAADTFALGRLANPPHPLWKHFESIHIIHHPTYASKYQPGRGLMLALGQVVGGHPAVGIWLGIALACASICWMLQGWVPPRWALLGGLIAALNLGFFGYWGQKFWGGAVAATGGALVFGAVRRLCRRPSVWLSIILGLGLIILANSRPFEGLVASVPVAGLVLYEMLRSGSPTRRFWLKTVIVPLSLVLCLGFIWIGYYNFRVSGKFWRLPYQVYETSYLSTPIFLWSSAKPVQGSPPQSFLDLNNFFEKQRDGMRTLRGFLGQKISYLAPMLLFFFRWVFLVPLIMVSKLARSRWDKFALLAVGLVLAAVMLQVQSLPRKLAPVTCLIILIIIQCLRHLRTWRWRGRPTGRYLVRLLLVIFVFSVSASFHPIFHNPRWPPSQQRIDLINRLKQDPARHVILVRYGPNHFPHFEWVYNEADIDASHIVWARELDDEHNRELIEYYQDRKVWLLEADRWTEGQVALVPYRASLQETRPGKVPQRIEPKTAIPKEPACALSDFSR